MEVRAVGNVKLWCQVVKDGEVVDSGRRDSRSKNME